MPSPESFSSNSETNVESLRAEYQARGHEVNQEVAKRREALLKRKAELEAKLKAAGVNIESVQSESKQPKPEPPKLAPDAVPKSQSGSYFDALDYTPHTPPTPPTPATEAPAPKPTQEIPEAKVEVAEFSPAEVAEKSRKNSNYRRIVTEAVILSAAALAAAGVMIGSALSSKNKKEAPTANPVVTESSVSDNNLGEETVSDNEIENTMYSGETIHGVKYDYAEYADRDNKISFNAYGYDYSDQYNDREKSTEGILGIAEREPEALASYAYSIFTDEEKEELGIKGLNMVEIDEKFDQDGGGELQGNLLNKFSDILKDEKNTSFKFYKQNGTEETNYVYFIDENNDGNYTPDELHLEYDTKTRSKAPQVDINRTIIGKDGKGKTVKMLDLNMECGYQPNYERAPAGVPKSGSKPVAEKTKQPTNKVTTPSSTPTSKPVTPPSTPPKSPEPITITDQIPTPTPVPPIIIPEPDPIPVSPEVPKPKDTENLKRIDEKIEKDIEDDIGTDDLVITPNPGVSDEDITEKPSDEDYTGTQPNIEQNEESKTAEIVQPTQPENNYSEDKGGANDENGYKPIQENDSGKKEADQKEIKQENAPTGEKELENALRNIGIY